MNKLRAATALACACAALACAGAAPSAQGAGGAVQRAETAARKAVAPLVVESAVCIRQTRTRVLCFLAHPDAGTQKCRSTVLVRARRVRVLQRNVCFEFRKVTP